MQQGTQERVWFTCEAFWCSMFVFCSFKGRHGISQLTREPLVTHLWLRFSENILFETFGTKWLQNGNLETHGPGRATSNNNASCFRTLRVAGKQRASVAALVKNKTITEKLKMNQKLALSASRISWYSTSNGTPQHGHNQFACCSAGEKSRIAKRDIFSRDNPS